MKKIPYPFEFEYMTITDRALDALGFGQYWGGSGDFGTRAIRLSGQDGIPGGIYRIADIDETDDDTDGYGPMKGKYVSQHYAPYPFEAGELGNPIIFLHELYEDIKRKFDGEGNKILSEEVLLFEKKCKEAKMDKYIDSWKNYRMRKIYEELNG